ncbi:hypothetical protein EMIHUDRAFT_359200, partial [Emiliania huxleyi CCMP1516]|uniref:Uncharacterized protein n=2 Tax=Emiliania huxleyi TaxID=2903 RepID=A0A0D3I912_EMIH1
VAGEPEWGQEWGSARPPPRQAPFPLLLPLLPFCSRHEPRALGARSPVVGDGAWLPG